ncbi:hypothetical protein [Streptomyces sp. NPDC048623]|uniref:hypothetical protein n=1 Tax=Streptomyces sp. NPDC048623 TaxID=3155761 RepID=UPI00343CBC59
MTDTRTRTDPRTGPGTATDLLLIYAQRTSTALLLTEAARRRGMAARVLDGGGGSLSSGSRSGTARSSG